jgi:hypothetical protein
MLTSFNQYEQPETRTHLGIIRLDRDLLRAALHLPEGTTIVDVSTQPYFQTGEITIKVAHPDLPGCLPCQYIPEVKPRLGVHYHEVREVVFEGW